MSDRPLLAVDSLSKSFGGVQAVVGVTFDLFAGDILGVIGPNGSGKTTLINLITGFVKKTSGTVVFDGKNITKLRPHKIADMGVTRTFQTIRAYNSLPAYKNLIVPLYSPRIRRRVGGSMGNLDAVAIDILEQLGFERDAKVPHKLASSLPLGYLKRLELARCIALRPEIIFCDEVLSGLSSGEITTIISLMERLRDSGITIVMIEHRLKELFSIANRVIVMNFGAKIADGFPHEVMERTEVKQAYLGRDR